MKFDKNFALGWAIGGWIGMLLSEFFLRPPFINHLFTANAMLICAIAIGFISGGLQE